MKKRGLQQIFIDIGEGLANGVGYDNLLDMVISVFAVRNWLVFLESVAFSVLFTIAICSTEFIETYIYAPELGIFIFNILIGLETFSSTWVKIKVEKNKPDFGKFLRGLVMKPVGQNLILILSFNMARASDVYLWLPITIWTIFTGVNFMKLGRNLVLSDVLQGDMWEILVKQFADKYQFKPKKEDGTGKEITE